MAALQGLGCALGSPFFRGEEAGRPLGEKRWASGTWEASRGGGLSRDSDGRLEGPGIVGPGGPFLAGRPQAHP